MSFVGRSWRYVARKRIKTIIIFAIFLAMSTVLMSANAVSRATDATAAEIDAKTGQGFVLGNNPQFNTGTPRGAGNVKPADIKKIAGMDGVENYVATRTSPRTWWMRRPKSSTVKTMTKLRKPSSATP